MEKKKFGENYELIKEEAQTKPKMSLPELKERLKKVHTLEGYWERLEKERGLK